MADKNSKSSKRDRQRKSGQNLSYKAEHRHEKGHVKRLIRHFERYGYAKDAADALMKYATILGLKVTQQTQAIIAAYKEAKAKGA